MCAPLKFFFIFYKTPVLLSSKCWYLAVFKCTEAAVGVYLSVTCGLRAHWLQHERPSLSCCHDRFVCLCLASLPTGEASGLCSDLWPVCLAKHAFPASQPDLTASDITSGEAFLSLLVLPPVFSFFSSLTDAQQSIEVHNWTPTEAHH